MDAGEELPHILDLSRCRVASAFTRGGSTSISDAGGPQWLRDLSMSDKSTLEEPPNISQGAKTQGDPSPFDAQFTGGTTTPTKTFPYTGHMGLGGSNGNGHSPIQTHAWEETINRVGTPDVAHLRSAHLRSARLGPVRSKSAGMTGFGTPHVGTAWGRWGCSHT